METRPAMKIPMIPGMISSQRDMIGRTKFHKGQAMEQMARGQEPIQDINNIKPDSKWFSLLDGARKNNQIQVPTSTSGPSTSSTKYRTDSTQPAWITNDRQVLRFFGYFQERVDERGREVLRVRRVVILFYLSDNSLSITEPRVHNSGCTQGEFLRRTIITKPKTGGTYTPTDFQIGGDLRLYGRTFHLIDADAATRSYYEEALSQPLQAAHKYPDDVSSQLDEIDAIKQKLKANASSITSSRAEVVRKFHENSQKVLRFYVSWKDPHPLYPEKRRYILHYYLSDDSMEIVEPRDERDGRGHFAVLLSRRKMINDDTAHAVGPSKNDTSKYITDRDLRCGDYVHVFSRRFLLEDCDPFTREYYLEMHGITQEKYEPDTQEHSRKPVKWALFQKTTGKESNSQSEVSVLDRLALQVHQDSHTKSLQFHQNDVLEKKQLRFRARFYGLEPENVNAQRTFVLTYYLEDDTLSVFEPRVKNSGVIGGRFLDRGRFRKAEQGQPNNRSTGSNNSNGEMDKTVFRASDFYVGAIISFEFSPQQRLELVEADGQTLSYCESHATLFPFANADRILAIISIAIVKSQQGSLNAVDLRRMCRAMETPQRDGTITIEALQRELQRILPTQLNAHELVTLCRKFDNTDDTDPAKAGSFEQSHGTPLKQKRLVYDDFCDAIAAKIAQAASNPANRNVYERLRKCDALRRMLRQADERRTGAVDLQEVASAACLHHVTLVATDIQELKQRFGKQGQLIQYDRLCDHIFQLPGAAVPPSMVSSGRQYVASDIDDELEVDDDASSLHSLRSVDVASHQEFEDEQCGDHGAPPPRSNSSLSSVRHPSQQNQTYRPSSPRHMRPSVPPLSLPSTRSYTTNNIPLAAPRGAGSSTSLQKASGVVPSSFSKNNDAVVALLQRVFGSRKYQLRKALRERDHEKCGSLGEEGFMDAILSVEPQLNDDDTYLIADVYFPTNNSVVDYVKLLETAFRT